MYELLWKILLILQPFLGTSIVTAFGGNFNNNTRPWYNKLIQSPLTPPPIVFPIVWTTLYLLIGISAVLIYNSSLANPSTFKVDFLWKYLAPYEVQIILNFIWSIAFFAWQLPKLSLAIVYAMIALTAYLLWKSWFTNRTAFWLLLPYGIWITFAMYLNFYIVVKN